MKDYAARIARLRARKLEQTQEKIRVEGTLDEDDYGRIVPPEGLWNIRPNHPDGLFYGYDAWTDNFCSLMAVHIRSTSTPTTPLPGAGCTSCRRCVPTSGIPTIRTTI